MSKLTEALRRVVVTNSANFCGRQPHIWATTEGAARGSFGYAWVVSKRGENISAPRANWHEKPNRWFGYTGGRKTGPGGAQALADAQAWASERFEVDAWARDPFGSYAPAAFVAARTAYLLYVIGLLDLISASELTEIELAEQSKTAPFAREAQASWFEAGINLLAGLRRVEVDAHGVLVITR